MFASVRDRRRRQLKCDVRHNSDLQRMQHNLAISRIGASLFGLLCDALDKKFNDVLLGKYSANELE